MESYIVGGISVHTHLKGRIFRNQGVSYLVLHEPSESSEWLQVKALDPSKRVERMRAADILRYLPELNGHGSQ